MFPVIALCTINTLHTLAVLTFLQYLFPISLSSREVSVIFRRTGVVAFLHIELVHRELFDTHIFHRWLVLVMRMFNYSEEVIFNVEWRVM
jgi:hypothetical protein